VLYRGPPREGKIYTNPQDTEQNGFFVRSYAECSAIAENSARAGNWVDDAEELIATNPASAPIDRGLYGGSQKSGPTQAQDTNGG
jgi:hypothetical protein